jgi:hypothetical protein
MAGNVDDASCYGKEVVEEKLNLRCAALGRVVKGDWAACANGCVACNKVAPKD